MTAILEQSSNVTIARDIAMKVRNHPKGVTSGELYDLCAEAFKADPHMDRHDGVDYIQKALSKLYRQNYVRYDERNGKGPRRYYPTDKLLAQYPKPATEPLPPQKINGWPTPLSIEAKNMKSTENKPNATGGAYDLGDLTEDELAKIENAAPALYRPIDSLIESAFEHTTLTLIALETLSRMTLGQAPLTDAPTVISDLSTVEDMLAIIRPDLSHSLNAARRYIEQAQPSANPARTTGHPIHPTHEDTMSSTHEAADKDPATPSPEPDTDKEPEGEEEAESE